MATDLLCKNVICIRQILDRFTYRQTLSFYVPFKHLKTWTAYTTNHFHACSSCNN